MKLFAFENISPELPLLPMAARRALDLAGLHLGLEGFLSLPLALRKRLVELGSVSAVELEEVRSLTQRAYPEAKPMSPIPDPDPVHPPERLLEAAAGRLSASSWAQLSALERYSLVKLWSRGKQERLLSALDEIRPLELSHVRPSGGVHMVDVSGKESSLRVARAEACVLMLPETFRKLREQKTPKADVLSTARLAGIMAAKRTPELIPLCHGLALEAVEIDFELDEQRSAVWVRVKAQTTAKTGVEMEALTGASIAALTLYDMLKAIDRGLRVDGLRLLQKSGGRSGDYEAPK